MPIPGPVPAIPENAVDTRQVAGQRAIRWIDELVDEYIGTGAGAPNVPLG